MYQRMYFNCEFNFSIPIEAYNDHKNARDYQYPNNNSHLAHSHFITT